MKKLQSPAGRPKSQTSQSQQSQNSKKLCRPTPKDVGPFNVGIALGKMWGAIDELSWASMGYTPSERNHLMLCITRMARIVNKQPRNKKAKAELKMLLQKYEEKFAWLDELW